MVVEPKQKRTEKMGKHLKQIAIDRSRDGNNNVQESKGEKKWK